MKLEPIKDNPLSRACPLVEVPLVWTGPGQAFCEHCRKDVHDLRGQSLIQIAQFMQTHKGACIMMGPAARSDETNV